MIRDDRSLAGLTLVELLAALVVLGILLASAVPAMGQFIERHRLRAAAEIVAADLRSARSETIARGGTSPLYLSFKPGPRWCYGLGDRPCDCSAAPGTPAACQATAHGSRARRVRLAPAFPGIRLTHAGFGRGTDARFEGVRGLARPGRVVLSNREGQRLEVRVSLLGRVRICVPGGQHLAGYQPC